jgi:tetratricopeptide (TPR) repeat protein
VLNERRELSQRLQLSSDLPNLDDAIGSALYARAFAFIRSQPRAWLGLEAKKIWYLLGNHEFVHDYDWLGEAELLGRARLWGLPFGVLLGAGLLGLWSLGWGAAAERALCVMLCGQIAAVLVANLLWFTSAQNRVPLVVPLAFAAGPGACTAWRLLARLRRPEAFQFSASAARLPIAAISCTLLAAQAFVSRHAADRPSAAHYYNLANVEESLGRNREALDHYAQAAQAMPAQPMFWLRLAHLAHRAGQPERALRALERLRDLAGVPAAIRAAAETERRSIERAKTVPSEPNPAE